jgi:heat shock protein HslJ
MIRLALAAALLLGACDTIPARHSRLADTHWRVTAINGRATPEGPVGYSMDFETRRIGARFGCNIIGGEYQLRGGRLTTDALVMTEMACGEPASSFEAQGSAILQQPMYLAEANGRLTLSNPVGTIVLLRQR